MFQICGFCTNIVKYVFYSLPTNDNFRKTLFSVYKICLKSLRCFMGNPHLTTIHLVTVCSYSSTEKSYIQPLQHPHSHVIQIRALGNQHVLKTAGHDCHLQSFQSTSHKQSQWGKMDSFNY